MPGEIPRGCARIQHRVYRPAAGFDTLVELHQIQVRYVALEDRALLRIATRQSEAQSEFRFWVTRRYSKLLLSALSKNVMSATRARPETPAHSGEAMLAFERESALARSDFDTRYAAGEKSTPLGEAPVLLARLGVKRMENGITILSLHPHDGQGIDIRLNDTLVHSLIKLVEDAGRSGDWELPETLPTAVAGGERMN